MHQLQKELLEKSGKHNFGDMTLREIGELVGESHPQKVKHHLDQLKRKGYIRESEGGSISPTQTGDNFVYLPIMGRANCGEPMAIADNEIDGYLTISKGTILKKNTQGLFILKAVGDSMNNAKVGPRHVPIRDGDYIVVNGEVKRPDNGSCVVSIIDGAANVKEFREDDSRIVLMSRSNRDYPPIIIDKVDYEPSYMIAGEVIDVIAGVKV
jgi:repressor LexA